MQTPMQRPIEEEKPDEKPKPQRKPVNKVAEWKGKISKELDKNRKAMRVEFNKKEPDFPKIYDLRKEYLELIELNSFCYKILT